MINNINSENKTEKKQILELQKQLHDYGKNIENAQQMLEMQQQWIEEYNKKKETDFVNISSEQMNMLENHLLQVDEKLKSLEAIINTGFQIEMKDRFDSLEEKTHTDCIKVYRNIQAVVVEEDSKQNKVITKSDKNIGKIKNRMTMVLVFSITSFIASLFVIIIEILPLFGVHLFK